MYTGNALQLETTQKLALTPELIQSIQILQYSHDELLEYIHQEMLENPFLEEAEPQDSVRMEAPAQSSDTETLLRAGQDMPDGDVADKRIHYDTDRHEGAAAFESYVKVKETLQDHLLEQLAASPATPEVRRICRFLIYSLDDNGYLTANETELPDLVMSAEADVSTALSLLQSFDPAGVGAASLEECLLLQLQGKGCENGVLRKIIREMLPDVAANRIGKIASSVKRSKGDVQELIQCIRALDPKPGRAFASEQSTGYIFPDVIITAAPEGFRLDFPDEHMPRLRISPFYRALYTGKDMEADPAAQDYCAKKIRAAAQLISGIGQRKQTILRVAAAIAEEQREFLLYGESFLKPLALKDISRKLNLSESTVSRAVRGKYIQCCQGMLEMKDFFSNGINTEGDSVSAVSIRKTLREMISDEDPRRPLSDQALSTIFQDRGITISRRTVAKYRDAMHIPASSCRRYY